MGSLARAHVAWAHAGCAARGKASCPKAASCLLLPGADIGYAVIFHSILILNIQLYIVALLMYSSQGAKYINNKFC